MEAPEAGHKAATAKLLAGIFASVKHTFPALEDGKYSASAFFGTRRCSVIVKDETEPDISRTLSSVSIGA